MTDSRPFTETGDAIPSGPAQPAPEPKPVEPNKEPVGK